MAPAQFGKDPECSVEVLGVFRQQMLIIRHPNWLLVNQTKYPTSRKTS